MPEGESCSRTNRDSTPSVLLYYYCQWRCEHSICTRTLPYDLNPSLLLALLALIGTEVGNTPPLGFLLPFIFAIAYTIPLTKPRKMAETEGIVTGASKKTSPETAMGSLFKAPTMEYVVDEVARTHQAEEYEIKMEERPVKIMAPKIPLRESSGKFLFKLTEDQSSTMKEAARRTGIVRRLL